MLLLLAMLYLCVFFGLGLCVSCMTNKPKTTLTALLTIWSLLVLVIPNFIPFLAARLIPVRSIHEVDAEITVRKQNYLQQLRGGEEVDWKVGQRQLMWFSNGESGEIRQAFLNEVEAQAQVGRALSLASPSAVFAFLASDIAGTGLFSEHRFRRAVMRYRPRYAEHLDRYIEETGDYERLWRVDRSGAPPFEYQESSVSQIMLVQLPYSIGLVFYAILFFLGAQIALSRSQF